MSMIISVKKSFLYRLIAILLTVSINTQLAAQGPWSPGKGHGYAQFLYNTVPSYTSLFDGSNGSRQSERFLSEIDLALYAEVGISDKLTLGATLPFISVASGDPNPFLSETPTLPADRLSALGNISLLGKYNLFNKSWNVALITQVDLPTSVRTLDSGLSTGVDALSIQPKVSFGRSTLNGFFYGFLGYGYRNNDHHDFLNFGIEAGLNASEKFTLILNLNRLHNLNNGDPAVDSQANIITGFYTSFQEYTGYLLKFFVKDIYNGFGAFASLGGGGGAVSVAASPALSLGIFHKW